MCTFRVVSCILLCQPTASRPPFHPLTPTCCSFLPLQFELHDVLELQQAALAEGRPRQQQSPAIYCGGLCWWAVSA